MFLLNLQSKVPIGEQIRTQIVHFIDAGVLSPGDKLPSIRQLARDNGINPNTVARAYSQLEKEGYVNNIPKKGVYVAGLDAAAMHEDNIRMALLPLKERGVTKKELLDAIEELYGEDKDA